MPGLSNETTDLLNEGLTVNRVRADILTDFILSPHYAAVFTHVSDELWARMLQQLRSGSFEPRLPITLEVPKPSRLSRPGSILEPIDRLVYQALIDVIAPVAETQFDRNRVFSYVLLEDDTDGMMFEDSHLGWLRMQAALKSHASSGVSQFAVRTDVASYFERLYQHNLINMLTASGCESGAVSLLEKFLSGLMQKDSHGIVQGIFPSDFLGNLYLCGLDANLDMVEVPSVRHVDDIYVFTPDRDAARRALLDLVIYLRREGLHLNESKTKILPIDSLVEEETELDRLFESARQEVSGSDSIRVIEYGFQSIWEMEEEDELSEEDIELLATEALYEERNNVSRRQREKVERFCLPLFAATQSSVAFEDAVVGITRQPHMAQVYLFVP